MSRVEFSESSSQMSEALRVLDRLSDLQDSQEMTRSAFFQKALASIDLLAEKGLRLKNPALFAAAAEKLFNLINGGRIEVPPIYHIRDYYNFFSNPEHERIHAARKVLEQEELLTSYLRSDKKNFNMRQKQEYSIILMNELFINDDKHIAKRVREIYSELQPEIIAHMLSGKRGFAEAEHLYLKEYPFTAKFFLEKVEKAAYEIPLSQIRPQIEDIMTSSHPEVAAIGESLAKILLKRMGFSAEDISCLVDQFKSEPEDLAESVDRIFSLEQKAHGSAKKLFQEQGIKHFGRYPLELLQEQLKYAEDKTNPWGVLIYPYADYNDSFYENISVFDQFMSDLKNNKEDTFRLRIVEGKNLFSIAKRLMRLAKKYGPASFAVVGGHGHKKTVSFGGEIEPEYLHKNDLGVLFEKFIDRVLIRRASVVLDSCLTGKKNGIAQELSSLGLEVFAPKGTTGIKKLSIWYTEDRPLIEPDWEKETDKRRYKNGRLVKE